MTLGSEIQIANLLIQNGQLKLDAMRYRAEAERLFKTLEQVLKAAVAEQEAYGEFIDAVLKAINSREWLTTSRGSYAWDDDRYKEEAYNAFREVREACKDGLEYLHSQTDMFYVPAWQLLERLEKELQLGAVKHK